MTEVLLENSVGLDGRRVLHVMGSDPISQKWQDWVPAHAAIVNHDHKDELNLHHLNAMWMAREVVTWTFQASPWLVQREVVLWFVNYGMKVSQAILDAAECYALNLGRDPQYAFLREMPARAEEGMDVRGIMLIQANWVPEHFVLLDCGGVTKLPGFRVERPVADAKQLKLTV